MAMQNLYVIGVDPGRQKCGLAVMTTDGLAVARQVVSVEEFASCFSNLLFTYSPQVVVLGDRTATDQIYEKIKQAIVSIDQEMRIEKVCEHRSSEEGRRRYLCHHRKGWRRLIPLGLQWPKEPFDDFVAEILILRFLGLEAI